MNRRKFLKNTAAIAPAVVVGGAVASEGWSDVQGEPWVDIGEGLGGFSSHPGLVSGDTFTIENMRDPLTGELQVFTTI